MIQRGPGNQHGLTFLEFLVVSSLLTVISGAMMDFVSRHVELQVLSQAQGELRTTGHIAVDQMVAELRHATRAAAGNPPNASIPPEPGNTSLTFYLPADVDGNGLIIDAAGDIEWVAATPIQYQYDAGARRLLRTAGGETRVLANEVAQAVFTDRTIDGALNLDEIGLQVTLQRTASSGRAISTTISAVVKLRN